jgi:signal transduction histidine kinase
VSLVRRLIWLAAGWILAALVVAGAILTGFFQNAAVRQLDGQLGEITDGLFAGATVANGSVRAGPMNDPRAQRVYSGRYWQIAEPAPDGGLTPLDRSRSLWDSDLVGPPQAGEVLRSALGRPVFYDTIGPNGEPLRAAALMAILPDRQEPVVFMAAQDRREVDRQSRRFAAVTAVALILLGLGLVIAVFIQVRIGLAPLFAVEREIAAVRMGKAQRLSGDYPEEIAPLGEELNALLDHNQEVVERQRTHVGNLAHALKTPLAVMLSEAAAHPGPLAEVVRHQAEIMKAQVDHHLRRARAAARGQTSGERTEVEPVLDELAVTLERVHQDKGVEIDWRAPENLCFHGERQDLQEIAGNVIENACKWCRGRVRVIAKPDAPGRFTLMVEDDGPGVPPEQRETMLKRGARLDESAPGSGLGLSIVDELARAYGGEVRLGEGAWGGLKVEIDLPRAED